MHELKYARLEILPPGRLDAICNIMMALLEPRGIARVNPEHLFPGLSLGTLRDVRGGSWNVVLTGQWMMPAWKPRFAWPKEIIEDMVLSQGSMPGSDARLKVGGPPSTSLTILPPRCSIVTTFISSRGALTTWRLEAM